MSLSLAATVVAAGALAAALPGVPPARAGAARAASYFDTLVLIRWGHGALDWLLPQTEGGKENGRN